MSVLCEIEMIVDLNLTQAALGFTGVRNHTRTCHA